MENKHMKQTDEELVREAYARLQIWRDGCRSMHERAREARRILLMQDPEQDAAPRREQKRTLQMQTLKSTFNNCVADQMDNMPEAVLLPETPELQPAAEDLEDVVRSILRRNRYEALHRRRVEDCFCTGTAVTQVVWDAEASGGRGDVALIRWPIEAFLWDPAAESLEDARAVFKVSRHPLSWFRARYPHAADAIGSEDGTFSELGITLTEGCRCAGDEDRALLLEYWRREWDAHQHRYIISVAYLAGGVLLYQRRDVYRHGMYPFVLDVYTPVEGMPAGDGLVQEMAPMMRYVNRYASYIDMNLRMASKGRLLVDRSAGLDREALCDWQTDIVEGDRIDAGAIKWLQTQPFGEMASRQLLQLQADIKQDSGQNQFSRGETMGGVTAASAISALQEAGGKITRLRTHTLNSGFEAIIEQILWLISQFYTPGRIAFITGRDGCARTVYCGCDRLFGGLSPAWSVQVQVNRRDPLRQQAQNELYLQAYEMCAKAGEPFPVSALFSLLKVDGKDRLMPVLREMEERRGDVGDAGGAGGNTLFVPKSAFPPDPLREKADWV